MQTVLLILGQAIVYALLMLLAEYAGFLIAVILGSIAFCVWLISHLTELIEPSQVSNNYYGFVLSCWVGPLLAVVGFAALQGGFYWMNG